MKSNFQSKINQTMICFKIMYLNIKGEIRGFFITMWIAKFQLQQKINPGNLNTPGTCIIIDVLLKTTRKI